MILGWGIVSSDTKYVLDKEFSNIRYIDLKNKGEWKYYSSRQMTY